MTTLTSRRWITALVAAATLAACSDDANQVAPVSFDSVAPALTAGSSPDASTSTAPATTAAVATTIAPTTAPTTVASTDTAPASSAVDGLTGPMFSDALGTKVDTAPGVHTRGDTRQLLPEGLYVHIAWEADPDDPSVFTVQPDDIPILEAYANAVRAYYTAAMTDRTTDAPEFDRFYADGGALLDATFAEKRASGEVLSLGAGVVLRPYVLADQRSPETAVVLDCYLEDEGYIAEGESRSPAELRPTGQVVTLVLTSEGWKVDAAGEGKACA